MTSPFLGEFMGTMVLCLIGNGTVANVVLKKSKGEGSGWIVILSGFAFAVMAGVFTAIACGSSDAHINPAVTLAFAVSSGSFAKIGTYWAAQLLGAFAGAILTWLAYLPHWGETKDAGLKLAVFSTGPSIPGAVPALITETIGTFLLVMVIAAIVSKNTSATGLAPGLIPLLVGLAVWAVGSAIGGPTGFAINPARDLGPRIAHALLPIPGKGGSDWGYAPIPVIGGLLGGLIAGLVISGIGL
jgi:glycerol uptake facilitator protein